jgi:hypothetical protein
MRKKQHQAKQTKPQQLENLYMKLKNWISYVPLLEMPIHNNINSVANQATIE